MLIIKGNGRKTSPFERWEYYRKQKQEYMKGYYERNKEKLLQYYHERYLLNKEEILQKKKEYNNQPNVKEREKIYIITII
jgi:hypothetical protein